MTFSVDTPLFIIHYTPLNERKMHLSMELNRFGFTDITWVTEKSISNYDIKTIYNRTPELMQERLQRGVDWFGASDFPPMSQPEIEVTTQHIEAIRQIVERGIAHAIILEDDVVFEKNFFQRMVSYCNQLPNNYDLFYFGSGCGAHHHKRTLIQKLKGLFLLENVFKRENKQSRYADSYMISLKAAKTFHSELTTFQFPIDWESNCIQQKNHMNIYWGEPTLTHQGSSSGKYQSGLRTW